MDKFWYVCDTRICELNSENYYNKMSNNILVKKVNFWRK